MPTIDDTYNKIQNTVASFCRAYSFPDEAEKCFAAALERLGANGTAWGELCCFVEAYNSDYNIDYKAVSERLTALAETVGVHTYTLQMVYLIALTPRLAELYAERGYSREMYDSSVLDLKWKLFECKNLYGIWGIFVGWWTVGFFRLTLFGMGRLEFNLNKCAYTYSDGVHSISKGDTVIDTHIPSSGSLRREECLASYARAARFFADKFPSGVAVFSCYSWLLSPNNRVILPPTSNIRTFADDFTLIRAEDDPLNANFWRIFGVRYENADLERLPTDTTVRKCFAEWVRAGNNIGRGYGLIFYKDGKILNK